MTMITNILTEKQKLLKHISFERRSRHFLPSVADSDEEPAVEKDVDFGTMADIIGVTQQDLTEALKDYKRNRSQLICDLIDVVYGAIEKETAIWCKLKMEDTEKRAVFRQMLFQHFSCTDLDKQNFIKMCDCIIAWKALQIDHDELYSVVFERGVDGKMFDQMDVSEFQGYFEAFSDSDHVAELHSTLIKWKYTESAVATPRPRAGSVPSFSRYSSVTSQEPDLDKEPSAVEQLMRASVPFISAVMQSVAELQNHKFEYIRGHGYIPYNQGEFLGGGALNVDTTEIGV